MIDPYTGCVDHIYGDIGGGCFARVYFWYDPSDREDAVYDDDLRPLFSELGDTHESALFHDACTRLDEELVLHFDEEHGLVADQLRTYPDIQRALNIG